MDFDLACAKGLVNLGSLNHSVWTHCRLRGDGRSIKDHGRHWHSLSDRSKISHGCVIVAGLPQIMVLANTNGVTKENALQLHHSTEMRPLEMSFVHAAKAL